MNRPERVLKVDREDTGHCMNADASRASQRKGLRHSVNEGVGQRNHLGACADSDACREAIGESRRIGNGRIHVTTADGDEDPAVGPTSAATTTSGATPKSRPDASSNNSKRSDTPSPSNPSRSPPNLTGIDQTSRTSNTHRRTADSSRALQPAPQPVIFASGAPCAHGSVGCCRGSLCAVKT